MRKLISGVVGLAMAGAMSTVVVPTAASAQGASTLVELCKQFGEAVGYESVGDCVGEIRSNAPRTCRAIQGTSTWDFFGFRNLGDCVSYIRSLQNG